MYVKLSNIARTSLLDSRYNTRKSNSHPFYHRASWSCKGLEVDRRAGQIVETIVKSSGLDPACATAKDIDELGPWLGCPEYANWEDI